MASSSNPTGESSRRIVDEEVSVLWDLNTCPVTDHYYLTKIVDSIENSLNDLHRNNPKLYPKLRLSSTRIVCGDKKNFGTTGTRILKNQGFDPFYAVERGNGCSQHRRAKSTEPAADCLLETYALRYAEFRPRPHPPRNILFITSDYRFHATMDNFFRGNHLIFLAYKCRTSHPNFGLHTNFGWDWEDMELGQNGLKIDNFTLPGV
ncbi:unnamed protein product [Arabidopsis lyrata]|uniref:Predicted protein n=2 Tax=Arabidopsis lyrata subsp. lyrata TaxID=81972 RepID=D7MEB2_ARALL|nr:predicted protein [Arabidopsis lyrata subsp. lyrata]EFH46114.1 predicted protein [Arabidopsis lyrata subsp. lyrata]CAH8275786.1 unnamed protein product [Arabidopsis lyrata]CAH8275789.1 unnamed protein product [Arabidopsis lyrata]